ncbi:uncharacterized protein RAG0_06438 [Rhynchosporium agropyri]|uniref:Uncharacterized protein n=3 Tax=Rhynchosporium TaxID=38037 RepID=A0A1E1M346_RHYSE|nr:uncharacterized protein RAG0_06438 [Rhynchosporium agropyri]CZT00943.1 uncharacterized protein RCO7_14622 [Rhynchosporium commune]CZT43537.1 uncharacterized protein RSE6_03593 [Rhynchosporium secalis]
MKVSQYSESAHDTAASNNGANGRSYYRFVGYRLGHELV